MYKHVVKYPMIKCITYFLFASIFLTVPVVEIWYSTGFFCIPYLYSIGGILLWMYWHYRNRNLPLVVSWIDILLSLLIIYNIVDIWKYDFLTRLSVFGAIYLLAKNISNESKVACILTASGCLQFFLMLLQLCDCLPSNHSLFNLTGSFENPGPLGGFLAISLIATISNYRSLNKWLRGIWCIILIIGIFLTDSRAAWAAVVIASLYIIMQFMNVKLSKQLGVMFLLLMLVGVFSLTLYKPQSAIGRIEIWKVCCNMIGEHPFTGNGIGSFQREYMNYQTHYIHQNNSIGQNRLTLLGNNRYAFNEFLHITCEQGFIGLLFVLIILLMLCRSHIRQTSVLFPCLIAFLVFSCFSYPCDVFLLCVCLALILGTLSVNVYHIVIRKFANLRYVLCMIGVLLIGLLSCKWINRDSIESAFRLFLYQDDYESNNYVCQHYSSVEYSSDFVFRYAYTLYLKDEYILALPIMKQAIYLYPTTDKYCDLGNIYQSLGEFKLAEDAFQNAVGMLPHLIYPHYCLFLLYKEAGKQDKANQVARNIMNMVPKIDNEQAREIKTLVENYMKKN